MTDTNNNQGISSHITWVIPALVALLAFGGQFAATLWSAAGRVEKYDSLSVRVNEVEGRIDRALTAVGARDLLQARLEERLVSVVQDMTHVRSEVSETNRHLSAIEDFLYRSRSFHKDGK